jgi:hypothetical protein
MQPTGIELGISFPPCRRRTRSCLAKPDKMISLFGKITGKMSSEKCLWGNNTYHPKWTVVHIPRPNTHILSNVDGPGFPQRWYSQSWNTLIWILFQKFNRPHVPVLSFHEAAESSCWASKAPVEHCCLTAAISTGMANLALSGHIVGCSHWTSPVDVAYKTYINHSPSFRSTNSTPGNLNYLTRPSAKQQVFIHSSQKRDVYLPFAAFSAFLCWSFICMPFAIFLSSSV